MHWKNAHRDTPPEHGAVVLLSVNGIYYITAYDSANGIFRLKDEIGQHFSPLENTSMYWLEIEIPGEHGDLTP